MVGRPVRNIIFLLMGSYRVCRGNPYPFRVGVVDKTVNCMKNDMSVTEFLTWCRLVFSNYAKNV